MRSAQEKKKSELDRFPGSTETVNKEKTASDLCTPLKFFFSSKKPID